MNGSLTLCEHPGDLVRLTCEKCGRAGQYRKRTLIERFGSDVRLPICARRSPNASERGKCMNLAGCTTSGCVAVFLKASGVMARHHFVPQFLLRNWATNGRFVAYYFEAAASRVIENPKAAVASACQIADLNTFFGMHASQRDFPETRFFTPLVDTPAAAALQVLVTRGVSALTTRQRLDWARLLVSFAVRTPETLGEMGPRETKKAFDLVEAVAKGPQDDERKVTAIIQAEMPRFKRNFPLYVAMELTTDPAKLAAVNGMTWWIRRWTRPTILIGDRPLLTSPRAPYPCGIPLNHPTCLIALPITPKAVFFASAHPKTKSKARKMSLSKIASAVNEETIWRSSCVYFSNRSLGSFVVRRIEGKTNGTWRPSTR